MSTRRSTRNRGRLSRFNEYEVNRNLTVVEEPGRRDWRRETGQSQEFLECLFREIDVQRQVHVDNDTETENDTDHDNFNDLDENETDDESLSEVPHERLNNRHIHDYVGGFDKNDNKVSIHEVGVMAEQVETNDIDADENAIIDEHKENLNERTGVVENLQGIIEETEGIRDDEERAQEERPGDMLHHQRAEETKVLAELIGADVPQSVRHEEVENDGWLAIDRLGTLESFLSVFPMQDDVSGQHRNSIG